MKKTFTLILVSILCSYNIVSAQSGKQLKKTEVHVRILDSLHAAAVLSGKLDEMDKYWTKDFIVTNPFNEIDRADRVRNGSVTYASFQRICEAVKIHGNTAILMGREVVVPKGKSPGAGKTINRRYTNIWMKTGNRWRLVARHASVICQ
jgi:hypothetical protein